MKQGEIWYANLSPTEGSEQSGLRPVVILSGNLLNEYLNIIICLPLTTKIKNYKGNLVLAPTTENGLKQNSEILTFHIRSISKQRLSKRLGKITAQQIAELKKNLNNILEY